MNEFENNIYLLRATATTGLTVAARQNSGSLILSYVLTVVAAVVIDGWLLAIILTKHQPSTRWMCDAN